MAGQLQALADGTYAGSRSAQVAQELEAVAGGLVQLAEDLGRPFLLFVVGMGKFGKSTLINALLGQRVAAMDALPKTWKIDVFTHTLPENVAEVRTYQGHVERLSVHKAVELIAEEERRREESEEKVWQLFQERARELSSVAEKEILRQELETLYLYRSPIVAGGPGGRRCGTAQSIRPSGPSGRHRPGIPGRRRGRSLVEQVRRPAPVPPPGPDR